MSRWIIALVLYPSLAAAQVTTGSIVGTVVDETGGVLPDATATLTSTAIIGGAVSQPTNDKGQLRFVGMAPGVYDLRVEAGGFRTYLDTGIRVELGATVERRIELELGLDVSIEVIADTELLDTRRSSEAAIYGEEYLENVPVARFGAFDLIRSSPGIAANRVATGPTIVDISSFGSATNENLFVLDGTDFTNPENGGVSVVPNLETVQEVEIISNGASAEYGNFQGAVINIVTRQGSDDVRGDTSFYWQPSALAAQPIEIPCFCPAEESGYIRDKYYDVTFQLGGPIARERAWFYGSFRYFNDASNQPGGDPRFSAKIEVPVFFAKVNWQVSPRVQWLSSAQFDDFSNSQPPSALNPFETTFTTVGNQVAITLADIRYAQSANTLWDFRASYSGGPSDTVASAGNDGDVFVFDFGTGMASGGPPFLGGRDRSRIGLKAKGSHYVTDVLNADHNLIFGAQLQFAKGEQTFGFSGGVRRFERFGEPQFALVREPWSEAGAYDNLGLFVEDSLRLGDRLTLNLGVRYDRTPTESADTSNIDGEPVSGLGHLYTWNVVAPRLGFVFDLSGRARTLLRGGWGRFYAGVYTGDLGRGHPGLTQLFFAPWDPNIGDFGTPNLDRDVPEVIDPDTRPSSTDQFSFGIEHELDADWVVGLSYVGKRSREFLGWHDAGGVYGEDVIEDPNGMPITVFPLVNDPEDRVFVLSHREDYDLTYDALVVSVQKRFSSRWQLYAHYTLGRGKGFQLSNDGSAGNPQSSSTWSFIGAGKDPNDDINARGTVLNDRTHMMRVQANGVLPRIDVGLAANFQYLTGFPWGPRFDVQLPQGDFGISYESPDSRRLESQTLLDLRVSKVFRYGTHGRIEILADIFNVLNESAAEGLATQTFARPLFGVGDVFVLPRRVMLGVKVAF